MRLPTLALLCLALTVAAEEFTTGPVRKVGEGYKFTEGPAWNPVDGAFYFSDIPGNTIHRWTPEGGAKPFADRKSRSNGIVVDPKGRLIFCEVDKRAVVLREADGTETTLADHCGGQALNAPNDLWLAPDGCVYFTLPKLRPAKAKKDNVPDNVLNGTLVRISANRKIIRDVGAAVGVEQPNGVVGSADGKKIWWTDGPVCKSATIQADGSLADPKVAADKGSDGLAVDEKGHLYTVTKTGLSVHGADGKEIGQIAVPESPSNMKFGGKDGRTLFITARTGVYVVEMKYRGDGFAK